MPVFEQAGYEVIAPNLPGRTPRRQLSSWAARILELLPGDFIPVGISMGGYLAFELWRQAPKRIPALVLADTRANADDEAGRAARAETIRVLREEGFDAFWEGLAPKLFAAEAPPRRRRACPRDRGRAAIENLVATVEALRDRFDSTSTLADIDVPALVLVGEEDALTPPAAAKEIVAGLVQGAATPRFPEPATSCRSSARRVQRGGPALPPRGAGVTGDELARLLAEDSVTLLDVRTPEEFSGEAGYPCDPRQGHIEGAVNIPLEVLMVDMQAALADLDTSRLSSPTATRASARRWPLRCSAQPASRPTTTTAPGTSGLSGKPDRRTRSRVRGRARSSGRSGSSGIGGAEPSDPALQASSISGVTSGWNWTPQAASPARKA